MTVTCPVCGKTLAGPLQEWPTFPFCSKKCRLIDLGRWLNGDYRLVVEEEIAPAPPADTED